MKKIFILIALLTLSVSAQNLQWIDTVGTAEKPIRIGDFDNNTLRGSWYYGRLPIAVEKVTSDFGFTMTTADGAVDTLSRILDSLAQTTVQGGYGTCNSLFDSLTSAITPFVDHWSVSILANDTIEVSTIATFPAYNKTVVPSDVPFTTSVYGNPKVNFYVRQYNISYGVSSLKYDIHVYGR